MSFYTSASFYHFLFSLVLLVFGIFLLLKEYKIIKGKGFRFYFKNSKHASMLLGILTGLLIRMSFSASLIFGKVGKDTLGGISLMSFGFLFISPVIIGFVVDQFNRVPEDEWYLRLFRPWPSVATSMVLASVIGIEGLICILMALPIWFILSTVGVLLSLLYRSILPTNRTLCLAIQFLPIMIASYEINGISPTEIHTVYTRIDVDAPPEKIWNEVRSVRLIEDSERKTSLASFMGFPKPLEATLVGEGVGAFRKATFAGGVEFKEVITEWQENETIGFSIDAISEKIPETTLDPHITIGGKFFDIIDGRYHLEKLNENTTRIHLSSRFRVSTNFNFYSSFWTDLILRSIQESILEVIKGRVEK